MHFLLLRRLEKIKTASIGRGHGFIYLINNNKTETLKRFASCSPVGEPQRSLAWVFLAPVII